MYFSTKSVAQRLNDTAVDDTSDSDTNFVLKHSGVIDSALADTAVSMAHDIELNKICF
jgi:hypothetical protein